MISEIDGLGHPTFGLSPVVNSLRGPLYVGPHVVICWAHVVRRQIEVALEECLWLPQWLRALQFMW